MFSFVSLNWRGKPLEGLEGALAIVHSGDLPARLQAAAELRHVAARSAAAAWSALRRAGE